MDSKQREQLKSTTLHGTHTRTHARARIHPPCSSVGRCCVGTTLVARKINERKLPVQLVAPTRLTENNLQRHNTARSHQHRKASATNELKQQQEPMPQLPPSFLSPSSLPNLRLKPAAPGRRRASGTMLRWPMSFPSHVHATRRSAAPPPGRCRQQPAATERTRGVTGRERG